MNPIRRARIASVILEELTVVLNRQIKDPRIPLLTLTGAEVTEDARQATVKFTFFGDLDDPDPAALKACHEGLKSCSPVLRGALAKALQIRHTPELIFKYDKGLSNAVRVHELLKQIGSEGEPKTNKPDDDSSSS